MAPTAAEPIVIIGGGLASASASRALREQGYDGDVVLVTAEPHHPYERPPLTKDYLRGDADRSSAFTAGEGWYEDHAVDVRLSTTVVGLDAGDRRLTFADGGGLRYDKLLLATGSTPRPLAMPGSDLLGVHSLRTVESSDLLHESLLAAKRDGAGRLVVVGDGWIGLEVAASARMMGLAVTVLGRGPVPLAKILGTEIGGWYGDVHRANGVELRTDVQVRRIVGADQRVTGVELTDGSIVEADVVVAGIGAIPNVGLAAAAGLELRDPSLGGGVAVDGRLQTSVTGIFAAGDIASIPSPQWGRPIRVEHWATALKTGPHAAKAMLGAEAAYDKLPYFFSDQFDTGMEYTGFVEGSHGYDRVVISGDQDAKSFVAFWLRGGRVQAGMAVNLWERIDRIEELIRTGREFDGEAAELRDFAGA